MKIKYLIEELKKLDPEGTAYCHSFDGSGSHSIKKISKIEKIGCAISNPKILIEASYQED